MKKFFAALTAALMFASVSFAYGYTPKLISKKDIKQGVIVTKKTPVKISKDELVKKNEVTKVNNFQPIKISSPNQDIKKAVNSGLIVRNAEFSNNNFPQEEETLVPDRLYLDFENEETPEGVLNIWSCELDNTNLPVGALTRQNDGNIEFDLGNDRLAETVIVNSGCWQTCVGLDVGNRIEMSNIFVEIAGNANSLQHQVRFEGRETDYSNGRIELPNVNIEDDSCITFKMYSKFERGDVNFDETIFSANFHSENVYLDEANCSPAGDNNCESPNFLLNNPALFSVNTIFHNNLDEAVVPFSTLDPEGLKIGEWEIESIDNSRGRLLGQITCNDAENEERVDIDANLQIVNYGFDGNVLSESNKQMNNGKVSVHESIFQNGRLEVQLTLEDADEDISAFNCGFDEEKTVIKSDNRFANVDFNGGNWNTLVPESLDLDVRCTWGARPPRVIDSIDSFMWQGEVNRGMDEDGNPVFASIYDTNIVNMLCRLDGEVGDEAVLNLDSIDWGIDSRNFEDDYVFDLVVLIDGEEVHREDFEVVAGVQEQVININPDFDVQFNEDEAVIIALRPNAAMDDYPSVANENLYSQVERPTIGVRLEGLQIRDELNELANVTVATIVERGLFREFAEIDLSEIDISLPAEIAFSEPYFVVEADDEEFAIINENNRQGQTVWSGELKNLYTGGVMKSIKFRHNTGRQHLGQTSVEVNINGHVYQVRAADWDGEYFEIEFPQWDRPFIVNGDAIDKSEWHGAANITPISVEFSRNWQGMNENFRVELVEVVIDSGVKEIRSPVARSIFNGVFDALSELNGAMGAFVAIVNEN